MSAAYKQYRYYKDQYKQLQGGAVEGPVPEYYYQNFRGVDIPLRPEDSLKIYQNVQKWSPDRPFVFPLKFNYTVILNGQPKHFIRLPNRTIAYLHERASGPGFYYYDNLGEMPEGFSGPGLLTEFTPEVNREQFTFIQQKLRDWEGSRRWSSAPMTIRFYWRRQMHYIIFNKWPHHMVNIDFKPGTPQEVVITPFLKEKSYYFLDSQKQLINVDPTNNSKAYQTLKQFTQQSPETELKINYPGTNHIDQERYTFTTVYKSIDKQYYGNKLKTITYNEPTYELKRDVQPGKKNKNSQKHKIRCNPDYHKLEISIDRDKSIFAPVYFGWFGNPEFKFAPLGPSELSDQTLAPSSQSSPESSSSHKPENQPGPQDHTQSPSTTS